MAPASRSRERLSTVTNIYLSAAGIRALRSTVRAVDTAAYEFFRARSDYSSSGRSAFSMPVPPGQFNAVAISIVESTLSLRRSDVSRLLAVSPENSSDPTL
jgi:hypothetical protein